MKVLTKFLILIALLIPNFCLAMGGDEIDLGPIRYTMKFVGDDNKIIPEYRDELLAKTGVNGNIEYWDKFKGKLTTHQMKGIAGEVAAKFFFESLGYSVLEENYEAHLDLLAEGALEPFIYKEATCTTKKGPDNGIDGIFFLNGETIKNHSHIVINEAKFRSNQVNLLLNDFGFVTGGIQQSHSNWNRPRFSWASCLPQLSYDKETFIRTATLLYRDGTLKLYEVRDKGSKGTIVGEFASEAPITWNIRKAYYEHFN